MSIDCMPDASFASRLNLTLGQVDDSEDFAKLIRQRYSPDTCCIAAGQSMGGLIATHLVLRDQSAWAGLILCSAAIDVEWNLVLRYSTPICHH